MLLNCFVAPIPSAVITYVRTCTGWLYLCFRKALEVGYCC